MSEKLLISKNEFFHSHAYVERWQNNFMKW